MSLRAPKQASPALAPTPETGRTRAFFAAGPVQARLRMGRPGDRFETEADSAADAVVHGRGPLAGGPVAARLTPTVGLGTQRAPMEEEAQAQTDEEEEHLPTGKDATVQSKGEEEEAQPRHDPEGVAEEVQAQQDEDAQSQEEEEAQAQLDEEEDEPLPTGKMEEVQSRSDEDALQSMEEEAVQSRGPAPAPRDPDRIVRGLRAGRGLGAPLPDAVRRRMEARFGAELSGVRIHTDSLAVQLTRALNAQAVANGRDIYFNEGRFAPGTPAGDHLLAHELAHTVQQGATKEDTVRLAPEADDPQTMRVRPEALQAIALARAEIGKVNSKLMDADGDRIGADRLLAYFQTAFGGDTIHPQVVRRITMVERDGQREDALPHWCGIFTWWALKTAGVPLPDWTIGMNILDSVEPRPPGSLPQKGDIAWRTKNQHFALVSGIDAGDVAAGTPVAATKIATINGNTAGADNLGGQVQEIWGPVSEWHVFFDPMGKLPMPEVELVETSLDPLDLGASPDAESPLEPAPTEAPTVGDAPVEGASMDPAAVETPDTAVGIELPPPPAMPPPPAPDAVTAPDLSGDSQAAVAAMATAAPAAMVQAATQGFGATVSSRLGAEQQEAAETAPEIAVQSGGALDLTTTPADQIGAASAEIGDGVTGETPRDLSPTPREDHAPAPDNTENRREMDRQPEGGFLAWLRNSIGSLMRGIRTTDNGVNTSAGPRERVALEGDADTGRLTRQRDEGLGQMREERDRRAAAFRTHPGQSNVSPRQVDERRRPQLRQTPETTPDEVAPSEEATNYRDARLGAEIRPAAEAKVAEKIDGGRAEARTKAQQAAQTRDTSREAKVAEARTKAAEASRDADADQTRIVNEGRADIAGKQGDSIRDAHDKVAAFAADATTEQVAKQKAVGDHVTGEEGKAHKKLDDAEAEAARKKREKEKEAADKKKKLEEDQKKGSWWDRAANAVKSAVSAVTSAIDAVFTALRSAVATIINAAKDAAIGLINAARNWVVARLNEFRDWAKRQVDTYLRDSFPGLADALDGAIDTVVDTAVAGVNAVADAAVAAVEAAAGALAAALDRILGAFQTALTAAVGVLGAVLTGDFAGALRIAIQAGCDIAGVDSGPVFQFIERAGQQIMAILRDLPGFFNNLLTAVGTGIRNFGANILQHLQAGLIGWLTGALGGAGITPPTTFDLKGIFSMVAQILGLTYANVKARVIRKFPRAEGIFDRIEQGMEVIQRIREEGIVAIWDMIRERLANLRDMVIGTIRGWVMTKVIQEGVLWLISLLNPASALVRVLKLMFDLVMWLVERFAQIRDFVMSVYTAVTNIAAGVLQPAAAAVEQALARSLPVVISLIASVLGLGGISAAIQRVVQRITRPINRAIDAVIDRVVAFARRLFARVRQGARNVRDRVVNFLWPQKPVSLVGENHTLDFREDGTPIIRSTPVVLRLLIADLERLVEAQPNPNQTVTGHIGDAKNNLRLLLPVAARVRVRELAGRPAIRNDLQEILRLQTLIGDSLRLAMSNASLAGQNVGERTSKFALEGVTGTFASVPKPTNDDIEGDHQPQKGAIWYLRENLNYNGHAEMLRRAPDENVNGGYVINLGRLRHRAGRTHGSRSGSRALLTTFRNRVDTISASSLSDVDKRRAGVQLLRAELAADVTWAREVYNRGPDNPVWQDIEDFNPPELPNIPAGIRRRLVGAGKSVLIPEIRSRVNRGLNVIAAQPMSNLE